jgi:hypothetical protein
MPSLGGLLIVMAVAFAAPFLLGLAPRLRVPAGGDPVARRSRPGEAAALVGAGLLSVLVLPAAGLALLRGGDRQGRLNPAIAAR